jgi:hypothetical protein
MHRFHRTKKGEHDYSNLTFVGYSFLVKERIETLAPKMFKLPVESSHVRIDTMCYQFAKFLPIYSK